MRRFFIVIGALLIVISVVFMLTFIVLPAVIPSFDSLPPLKSTFQALFCKPGETLVDSRSTYRPSPGTTVTSVNLACVNAEKQARDISSAPIPVGAVGYLVPFLVGLFTLMLAINSKKSARTSTYTPSSNPTTSATFSAVNRVRVDPELQALLKLEATEGHRKSGATGTNISEELSKLAQLHKNGDLSDAEFESAKKKLLG